MFRLLHVAWAFAGVVALLAGQAFMHDNFRHWHLSLLWKLHLLSTSDALLLLATLLGVVVTVMQFEITTLPQLVNTNGKNDKSDMGLRVETNKFIWRCTFKNVGGGSAVMRGCTYKLTIKPDGDKPGCKIENYSGYKMIVDSMDKSGFALDGDFGLLNISPGVPVGAGLEYTLMEYGAEVAARLESFDIKLESSGLLGQDYTKEISPIPKAGMSALLLAQLSKTKT
jgi:hypothetical protein